MQKNKSDALEVFKKTKAPLKKYRQQFEAGWKKEEKYYYGDIWESNEFRPYENGIFPVIESIVPVMTDAMTGTVAQANDPEFEESAKVLTASIEWVYKNQSLPLLQPILARKCLISAPGFLYVTHDQDADGGQGEIKLEMVDWRNVWLDGSVPFIEHARKAVFGVERDKEWLKLKYPQHKEAIDNINSDEKDDNYTDNGRERYDNGGRSKRKAPTRYKDDDLLLLEFCHVKDYSLVKIPEEDTMQQLGEEASALDSLNSADVSKWQDHDKHIEFHMNKKMEKLAPFGIDPNLSIEQLSELFEQMSMQQPEVELSELLLWIKLNDDHIEAHNILKKENPTGQMPKYKNNWRVIEKVQSVILYDGESKDDHCEIPLVPFYCYQDGTIYSFGEIRNLIDSQNMQAVMAYKEYKGLQKVANPEKHVDLESGLTKEDITNEDGAVYIMPQGTTIRNIDPGMVSPQLSTFQKTRTEAMAMISGVNEVTQGEVQNPNASGVAIKRLQQQAIGRIRLKQRQVEYYSMVRLGRLVAANIIQHWTNEKTFRITDQPSAQQYIFNPIEMQELKYEISPVPGSMAGVDKDAYNTMLLMFLNNGQMSFEQFLKVAELPRKEKIIEMVRTDQQTAEQVQAMQQEIAMLTQTLQSLQSGQSLPTPMGEAEILNQGVVTDQPIQGVL